MITWFRNLLTGPGKWIFLGLVVVSFAAFGDFDLSRFSAQTALRVGDRAYTVNEVERLFARQFRIRQQEDPSLTRDAAIEAGLLDQTIAQLRVQSLVEQEAERLGLTATDDMIQRFLRESGAFSDPVTGEFDPSRVQLGLQRTNTTPQQFREELRSEIVRGQLVSALALPARAPEELVRLLVLRAGEERALRTAVVTAEAAPEPDEMTLRSFYSANAEDYRAPELRTYRALIVDEASVADRVEVPDSEVRQAYEARRAQLGEPERRTFRQAVFRDQETADAAEARVAAGEALQAVAADLGASSTRAEGQARRDILDPAVAEAVFGAEGPGLVGPVAGTFGIVLAEVEEITPGTEVAFEDVEEELRETRRAEKARTELFAAVEEVELAFDEGASLAEAASAAGLAAPRTFGPVDADLFTPDGAIETAPGAVQRAAFSLGEGEESGAITLDEGGYAFVIVDEVRPASTRPFETVAAQVEADYRAQSREEALDAAVDAFRERVASGQSFEEAAATAGSDVQEVSLSARRPDPSLPQAMLRDIFDAEIGGLASAPVPGQDSAVIAIVDTIAFEADPNMDALFGSYQDQVGQQVANELLEAYLAALETEFGVERDDALLARQFGQGE